ncbi:MAG: hypothetical protein ACREBW_07655, partial [Candidatus Micrarchaeaceae archaeon]
VILTCALASRADIIVLVEPGVGLDSSSIEVLREWMYNSDKTILLASHELQLVSGINHCVYRIYNHHLELTRRDTHQFPVVDSRTIGQAFADAQG